MGSVPATTDPILVVEAIHARIGGEAVLSGVDLALGPGELHAVIAGPDSGAGALAHVLLGDPAYEVTAGRVLLRGEDVTFLAPDARAKLGMFLAFAHPAPLPGAAPYELLARAASARGGREVSAVEIRTETAAWLERLGFDPAAVPSRFDEGGDDHGRAETEMLQMALFEPEVVIVERTGTVSDPDAIALLLGALGCVRRDRPEMATLVVTDDAALVDHLEPDAVHLLSSGTIAAAGVAR